MNCPTMKAISLYQPWASLLGFGAKPDETRSWVTHYRGPIAIHAGMMLSRGIPCLDRETVDAMRAALFQQTSIHDDFFMRCDRELPHGAIIATAKLVECWRVIEHTTTAVILKQSNGVGEDKISLDDPRLLFGDYSVGRYIWGFADTKLLDRPIPVKGRQGLWNWTPPEEVAV